LETPVGGPDLGAGGLAILPSISVDGGWLSGVELAEYRKLKLAETRRVARRGKRRANGRETGERVVALVSTMFARLAVHVIAGNIDGWQVGQLEQKMASISVDVVRQLRFEGRSWAEVGECFGMTKQGAQQRWGRGKGIQ
jgi:hypothetical protein